MIVKYNDDKKEKHQSHDVILNHDGGSADGFTNLYVQAWGHDKETAKSNLKVELKRSILVMNEALAELRAK